MTHGEVATEGRSKEWLSRREVAQVLGVSVATVTGLVSSGKLNAYRFGVGDLGRLSFRPADVEAFIASRSAVRSEP